ncbi:hypothetical protein ANO11243_047090 [Dothideomycetidae sp. 11243]|nr:hypothetical protein ANO11243_047090 [fungal sp. No.11243]
MVEFSLDRAKYHVNARINIKRPAEVAYFSYDEKGELHPFSDRSLRYYFPAFSSVPHAPRASQSIDLSNGFDKFKRKDDSKAEHLDSLLATIEALERRDGKKTDVNFITWRGMMTKLVTALYDQEDEFEMLATLYQTARNQKQAAQFRKPRDGFDSNVMTYWGYKFEALSLLKRPHTEASREEIENRDQEVVENSSQYCSIVRTGIGNASFIIGGEVDGVMGFKPDNSDDPHRWIELKTARKPESPRDFDIHSKKLLKFWAQSYLVGCPTVIVGYRDRRGILYELEELETHRLQALAHRISSLKWEGNDCLHTVSAFLGFLKQNINGPGVWRLSRGKGMPWISVRKESDVVGTGNIISESFKRWRESPECATEDTAPV